MGPNRERGLYKTTDGGRTWQNVLYINDDTGVGDVVLDRTSPDTVYAAAYQRRRTVFGFNGGGPFGAIYKTTDGGATWKKMTRGLPYENAKDGDTGRIGLAIYRRNTGLLYAIIEHANGGVFRSEDKGETWTRMSDINPRPPYFSQIYIDPNHDQRIWVLGVLVWRPPTIVQRASTLSRSLEGYTARPTPSQMQELDVVSKLVKDFGTAVQKLVDADLAELNRKLSQAGVPPISTSGRRFER